MFLLKTDQFPGNSGDLTYRLNESLRDVFELPRDPVVVQESGYPHLSALTVSLDGAEVKRQAPAIPSVSGNAVPALTVDSFNVSGSGLAVGPATIDFKLEAAGLELRQATNRDGNIVLLLHNAAQGRIDISTAIADLESLIGEVVASEAGKHGVAVDKVQLSLTSNGPRSLAAEVRLRGRKLFMSASLRIAGAVDLDDKLNARVSGLDCTGDGAIASVACGILKPQLQKIDGRVFPLMSLPIGEVRLRDVRIATGEKLSVTAEFAS
ncbi:MAG: hypothetical protein ACJ8M4_02555 [Chthoniobacterales bacterium]